MWGMSNIIVGNKENVVYSTKAYNIGIAPCGIS